MWPPESSPKSSPPFDGNVHTSPRIACYPWSLDPLNLISFFFYLAHLRPCFLRSHLSYTIYAPNFFPPHK